MHPAELTGGVAPFGQRLGNDFRRADPIRLAPFADSLHCRADLLVSVNTICQVCNETAKFATPQRPLGGIRR